MRHLTNLIAMAFMGLVLAGCTGECEDPDAADCVTETDVDTDTDTDTDSDTDTDADVDMATLSVGGTIDGVSEECQVKCFGPQNYEINTAIESAVDVEAGQYTCTIGGTEICGGVPCHPDSDGVQRVSPALGVDLAPNESGALSFPLARYLDAEYECTHDSFWYDEEASDFKGNQFNTGTEQKQRLQIVNGHKLKAYGDSTMNLLDADDYIEALNNTEKGDHFALVEVGDVYGAYIENSSFGNNSFSFTLVSPGYGVVDVTCVEK